MSEKLLTETDYLEAARFLRCEVAAIKAVASVEASGSGFLPDGRPKILFEGHIFSELTGHKFDATHPTISYRKWTKKFYKGGAKEYERFNAAAALNWEAAVKATSWNKFQVLGKNYAGAFPSLRAFYDAMQRDEGAGLLAFCGFVKVNNLTYALRNKLWAQFALGYNGDGYAANHYDVRMARAYAARPASEKKIPLAAKITTAAVAVASVLNPTKLAAAKAVTGTAIATAPQTGLLPEAEAAAVGTNPDAALTDDLIAHFRESETAKAAAKSIGGRILARLFAPVLTGLGILWAGLESGNPYAFLILGFLLFSIVSLTVLIVLKRAAIWRGVTGITRKLLSKKDEGAA